MLVLTRWEGEVVIIRTPSGESVRVKLIESGRGRARIGFEADRQIEIDRLEVSISKDNARGKDTQ